MVRRAIESLYKGKCTVYQYDSVTDPLTKRTSLSEVVSCVDQPCRLSYSTKGGAIPSDTVSKVNQVIKLFIAPEIDIKAGAKIVVTQNNVIKTYIASGEPSFYSNHQEITLTVGNDKA